MQLGNRSKHEDSLMLSLRINRHQKDIIDMAAEAAGKSRTSFLLEAAYKAAEETLLDQRIFNLTNEQWDTLHQILDQPLQSNTKLERFLNQKAPWESVR